MKKSLSIVIIAALIIGIFSGVVNASGTKTVKEGETVSVTIPLGKSVTSAGFSSVTWSGDKLQYVSNSLGKSLSNGGKLGFFGDTEISSVTLNFKALSAGTATVTVNISEIGADSVNKTNKTTIKIESSKPETEPSTQPESKPETKPSTEPSTQPESKPETKPSTGNESKPSTEQQTKPSNKPSTNTNTKPSKNNNSDAQTTPNKIQNNNEENNTEQQGVEEKQLAPNELISIDNKDVKTLKDNSTNIIIKALNIALDENTELKVEKLESSNKNYDKIENILKDIKGNKTCFDIQLLKDSVSIQPNGYVTVFLPIPEEYNKDRLEMFYVNVEDGTYELIEGKIQENYYTFTTNHFSKYVLIEKAESDISTPVEEVKTTNYTVWYVIIGIVAVVIIAVIIIKYKRDN